ncbi:hypothetical protein BHE74_00007451 [Ensete ventricosum]|nr:hypothetical protein BHE74_00007451 [Ensete ventricosum]
MPCLIQKSKKTRPKASSQRSPDVNLGARANKSPALVVSTTQGKRGLNEGPVVSAARRRDQEATQLPNQTSPLEDCAAPSKPPLPTDSLALLRFQCNGLPSSRQLHILHLRPNRRVHAPPSKNLLDQKEQAMPHHTLC